jgi:starch synthase
MDSPLTGTGAPPPGGWGAAALYFDPDAYTTSRPDLLGRDSAGEGFVKALARHGRSAPLLCLAQTSANADALRAVVEPLRGLDSVEWVPMTEPERLEATGCLMIPDSNLPAFAWQRRAVGQRAYALCGLLRAPPGATVTRRVADLLHAPVEAWDALVCVSTGVRQAASYILDEEARYLEDRFDATRITRPMLPVIPLGVDPGEFAPDPAARAAWRKRLGIGSSDFAVLCFGRINAQSRANPIALFHALEEVAARVSRRVHVIQAGWFGSVPAETAYRAEASSLAPSVNAIYLDGRDPAVQRSVWAAADTFALLGDAVQDTFPLTPLEAMAAALPVVVSDWNGAKDLVRHGVDGFRIPTLMPPPGSGPDIAARYVAGADGYDQYVANAAMFAMVDIPAAVTAFETLARNPDLRQSMGETGRKRARETYAWPVVVRQYEELWAEQAERRGRGVEAAAVAAGREVYPAMPDPFSAYAAYPTRSLRPDDQIGMVDADGIDIYERLRVSPLVRHARAALPSDALCRALLEQLARGTQFRVRDVVAVVPAGQRRAAVRALVWFGKMGIVRIGAGGPAPSRGTRNP